MDIVDGSVYHFSGDHCGVKEWFGKPGEPMDALGLCLSSSPLSITFLPNKQVAVSRWGIELLQEATAQTRS